MRLIDADAIVHYQTYDDEREEFHEHESTIADFLDEMTDEGCPKTVYAVPVVRCRDCEHKDRESGFCHGRGWPMQLVPDDGFCDKGAVNRRTDGTAEKTEKTV
jgi:hypothetical protein